MTKSDTTLYFVPGTCAQAVLIALYEAGADFTLKTLSFAANEQRSPEYLAINPKSRVPALVTPQGVLTEVPALLLYVAQTHPQANLAPLNDPFALAHMQEFNAYLASTVHISHAHRPRASRWADDEAAQASMRAKVPQNMRECFTVIETHYLGDKPWVMGDQFTVADGYLYTMAGWLESDGVDIAEFPRVAAHSARVRARASAKKVAEAVA
ncbi:glutathione S-transferase family protein [Ottowia thiooxydans]|uniref:glutathione S-transferase family protein n=1 Tax=Ottowia thiooxydans TaxID=219182 RepID=UPI0003FA4011|nr:glutathione S-transferase family protein [Ottowia thiooxydans]